MHAIELTNVSKIYRKYGGRHFATLKSALLQRSIMRDLQPNETFPALTDVSFRVPKHPARTGSAYLRFIPRTEMDIAVVGCGVVVTLDEKGVCTAAKVVLGAVAPTPVVVPEAASALGLSHWKTTGLIVLPQALRHVIPGLVNSFIALFKDTTLVLIVALFDLLGQLRASFADPNWATPTTLFTGFAFTGIIYFVVCFAMSRYSLFVERRLNAHRNT